MSKKGFIMTKNDTIEMRLEGILWACDFGIFDMPVGAEIDHINGRWGVYTVHFTDPDKYPPIEVQTDHEIDGKRPDSIKIWDEEGAEYYDDSL